jgi:ribonuclease HII
MIYATLEEEKKLWEKGFRAVCGIDEVGRGCFAGPVVVGAVIFPKDVELPTEQIADSKLLKPLQRKRTVDLIKSRALAWAVVEVGVPTINKVGIGKATQVAFRKVVKSLEKSPDFVLMDAFYINRLPTLRRKNQKPIIKGDQISVSIAAASILAKVYRDKLMKAYHKKYPQYHFGKHKGYGTKLHQEAIRKYGLTRIHRKSFNLEKFLSPAR